MIATEQVVALGGFAVSQVADSGPVEAVTYGGDIADGLSVVKLMRQELVQAEDLMMEALGLKQLSRTQVGFGRDRAIGFPAWPIMHDPGNARHALALVKELQVVEKVAKFKPGNAKDSLMELALRLDGTAPHFLSTFWEEASRIFIRANNIKMARQLFSRAREAERIHSLPVDEGRHAAAFLEFALAGALTGKELSAESKAIAKRVDPRSALEYFQRLLVEQVRAGVPPYAGALKDLGALAKAANVDEFAVKSSFLTVLLNSRAALRASEGFYKAAVTTLKKMVAQDPAVFEALLTTFPDSDDYGNWSRGYDRISPWISNLDKVGFTDKLIKEASPEAAAAWINEAYNRLTWCIPSETSEPPSRLRQIVLQMKQLAGQTVTIKGHMSAPLIDAVLRAGMKPEINLEDQRDSLPWRIGFEQWELASETFDMPSLAKYLSQEPALVKLVSVPEDVPRFLEQPGTTEILRLVVVSRLKGTGEGDIDINYHSLRLILEWLGPLMESPEFRAHFAPEIAEITERASAQSVLAATLRQGLLTEFEWPAMQQAIDELTAEAASEDPNAPDGENCEVRFHPSWPAIGVSVGGRGRVIFVEGENRVADESFVLPSGQLGSSREPRFIMAMGQVGCTYSKGGNFSDGPKYVLWSDAPGVELETEVYLAGDEWTFEVPEGRLAEGGIVRPGEAETGWGGHFLTDGTGYWEFEWFASSISKAIREIDPETGRRGRHSAPSALAKILEPYALRKWELRGRGICWLPAPDTVKDSPLIAREGILAWIPLSDPKGNSFYLLADGEEFSGPRDLCGVLNRPGGGTWFLTDGRGGLIRWVRSALDAVDENFDRVFPALTRDANLHWIHGLSEPAYVYLNVRDEAASARLRSLTAEQSAELYDTVAAVAPSPDSYSRENELARNESLVASVSNPALEAAEALVGAKDPALCEAIVILAAHVKGEMERFEEMKRPSSEKSGSSSEVQGSAPPSYKVLVGLHFFKGYWSSYEDQNAEVLSVLDSILHGEVAEAEGVPKDDLLLLAMIHPELLIAFSVVPGQRVVDARAALAMARIIMDTELYTERAQAFEFESEGSGHWGRMYREEFADQNVVAIWRYDSWRWSEDGLDPWRGVAPQGVIPREISGRPVTGTWSSAGHSVDVLLRAVDDAESLRDSMPEDGVVLREQSSEAAARLAQCTGWNESTARYFLAGLPVQEESLTALGLTDDELHNAHVRMTVTGDSLLTDMMLAATADPVKAVKEGLDMEAAIEVWLRAEMTKTVSDDELRRLNERADKPRNSTAATISSDLRLFGRRLRGEVPGDFRDLVTLSGIYVTLALQPSLAQPAREWVAQELEWLAATARAVKCTVTDYGPCAAAMLGLGKMDIGDTYTDGAWTVTVIPDDLSYKKYEVQWDSSLVEDWDAEVKRLSVVCPLSELAFLVGSGPADYAQWLRVPVQVPVTDPLVTAPEVVADVVQRLDVPEDTARYYVQLLALHDPTDANVQEWNGWSKKERVAAAQPLLERGLIVEAKRARARRSYFLPGGWREAVVPHLPLETWKASAFGLVDTLKAESSQFRHILPLRPYPDLFADAWQRVVSGDAPEFGKLE